jgi:hypothetical protein
LPGSDSRRASPRGVPKAEKTTQTVRKGLTARKAALF